MKATTSHPSDRLIPQWTAYDAFEDLVAQSVDIPRVRELAETRPLRIKLGIDPTSSKLHVGRAIPLWRLRAFQELGHEIHFVIGDATSQIGDTSDKDAERPMLSAETVAENMATYEEQLWWILNPDRADQVFLHYNSSWLNTLTFAELSALADHFSVNDFIKRDVISKRLDAGKRVSLREQLYPLMQGYDSVVLQSDIEIGGNDQWFNLLAGRTLQEAHQQLPQAVLTNVLINGTDGRKMSSSYGNVIPIMAPAFEMYMAVLQSSDTLLPELVAMLPYSLRPWSFGVQPEGHPMDHKKTLGELLVALYHGHAAAAAAVSRWESERSGTLPPDIATLAVAGQSIVDVLVASGMASSRTAARTLVEQKAIKLDDIPVTDSDAIPGSGLLQIGKHRYLRLTE
jgi:tyrosyl-tRNA synthetase